MRRAVLLGVLCVLAAPAPASADPTLFTLTTPSKFVDPAKEEFNKPPCGAPARPNALRVNVLLPDGYDGASNQRWPVLYLLHGHGDSYDAWVAPCDGNVREIAKGFPGIIVMPEAAQGWYTNWWDGGKRDRGWERYYEDELIPLITKTFRILPQREYHAIAGLSMGGEGAAYLAEQLPGYFGSMATFSGTISIQRPEYANGGMDSQGQKFADVFGPADGFYATGHNPEANTINLKNTRVYVTVGNGVGSSPDDFMNSFGEIGEADLHQHADDFVAAAKADGVDVTYAPRDGIHAWSYWRQHLAAALQWGFFKPVPDTVATWTERTVQQTGRAWGFRWSFDKPPSELITFKRDGDKIGATGSGTVTITAPNGRAFTQALPFERAIPAAPPKKKSAHRKKRRRRR